MRLMSMEDCLESLTAPQSTTSRRSLIRRAAASWYYQLCILFSYKMHLALEVMDVVLSALIYYFVSFMVSSEDLVSMGYTPDYLAFSISGIALSRYIWTSVSRLAHKMHHEISAGTFESLAAVDVDNFRGWLLGQVLYGFTWSSMWFVGALLVGYALGAGFMHDPVLWMQAALIVLLVVAVHSGIGIMAAGMYILHKQLEPLLVMFSVVIEFFGGVVYPLALLRGYPVLYAIAILIPFTHGMELFRQTIICGRPLCEHAMLIHLGVLIAFLPIVYVGLRVFEHYLNVAKRRGLLSAY